MKTDFYKIRIQGVLKVRIEVGGGDVQIQKQHAVVLNIGDTMGFVRAEKE